MAAKCDLETMLARLKSERDFILVPVGKKEFETIPLENLSLTKFEKIVANGLLGQDYLEEGTGGGDNGQLGNSSHRCTSKKSRPDRIWKGNKR